MTTETSTDVGAEVSRLSTAEYLSSHGERCPYCGGAKIEWASSPGITAPAYMFIEMGCADCRKTWVTVWRLSSYIGINTLGHSGINACGDSSLELSLKQEKECLEN